MWPHSFGSGWIWNVLVSAGFLAIVIAGIVSVLVRREPGRGRGLPGRDRLEPIQHQYEEGDLSPWEFARLMSPRPVVQYNAAAPVKMPGACRVPVH